MGVVSEWCFLSHDLKKLVSECMSVYSGFFFLAVEANLQGESISQTINEVDMDALEVCVLLELNNDTLAVDLNITLQLSGMIKVLYNYSLLGSLTS